ncbi:MAG: MFS transporter [Actinomycetaceae bacterium]|nr:MFS transporter [Actinomycetaceae bacterium]
MESSPKDVNGSLRSGEECAGDRIVGQAPADRANSRPTPADPVPAASGPADRVEAVPTSADTTPNTDPAATARTNTDPTPNAKPASADPSPNTDPAFGFPTTTSPAQTLPTQDSPSVKWASRATLVTFFLSGFTLATFLSRIPTVRDLLALSPAQMGHLLLVGALGSVLWLPISGPVVARFGPRNTVWTGFAIWSVGAVMIASSLEARSPLALAASLFVFQAGTALWNSTMNVEGGFVELLAQRPIMPWYHAAFSIGTVAAAGLGAVAIATRVSVPVHLLSVAAFSALAIVWAGRNYIPQPVIDCLANTDEGATARTRRAWKERRTVLIGVMVLGTGLMEGAANDWLALAMVDGFGLAPATGTLALALFLTVLTLTRLISPSLQTRVEPVRLLRSLLVVAIVGLLLLALSPWVSLAVIGVAAWGVGSALGFPSAASALARDAAMAPARMSVLSTIGYGAFLAGPPVIGYIAEHVGYRGALGFIALPVLVSVLLAGNLRPEDGR